MIRMLAFLRRVLFRRRPVAAVAPTWRTFDGWRWRELSPDEWRADRHERVRRPHYWTARRAARGYDLTPFDRRGQR
jgi:hypothetical protein